MTMVAEAVDIGKCPPAPPTHTEEELPGGVGWGWGGHVLGRIQPYQPHFINFASSWL
jgi:hypothetical protein